MTWREVLELLKTATDEQLDSQAFVSCDPTEHPAEDGFRYHGVIDCIQTSQNELQACFVGDPNCDLPSGYILMPRNLTAENGAKAALSGEFYETCTVPNPDFCGCGQSNCDECDEDDGEPEYYDVSVPVSWTTIKMIHAKCVKHFEAAADANQERL